MQNKNLSSIMGDSDNDQDNSKLSSSTKRVVLGEITNFSNVVSERPFKRKYGKDSQPQLTTRERNNRLKKENEEGIKQKESNEISSASRKCGYSSSIYEHLRSLEV